MRVEASTGSATEFAPLSAASYVLSPMRWWRWIDSRTTTASSTSRPIASVRPPSVKALSDCPVAYRTMSVMANDSGIATETMSVPRTLWRKSRMTRPMRTSAWTISFLSPW